MKPVPRVWWDWHYTNPARTTTVMRVESDHPDYPLIAEWPAPKGSDDDAHVETLALISRAQVLIADLNEGRVTFKEAVGDNA